MIGWTAILLAGVLTLQDAAPAPVAAGTAAPASDRLRAAAPVLADTPDLVLLGYAVAGRSPAAVRRAIDAARPASGADGARHDAVTRWSFQTRWRNGADGQCAPGTATVAVTVTVVLPDLTTREGLSPRERADWDRYFAALVGHEHNHARIAVLGAERIREAMRTSPSCEAMRAVVPGAIAEVSAASAQYDLQTGHGQREGAVYPGPTR